MIQINHQSLQPVAASGRNACQGLRRIVPYKGLVSAGPANWARHWSLKKSQTPVAAPAPMVISGSVFISCFAYQAPIQV